MKKEKLAEIIRDIELMADKDKDPIHANGMRRALFELSMAILWDRERAAPVENKVVCAWHEHNFGHQLVMKEGVEPVSHGICDPCAAIEFSFNFKEGEK